MHSHHKLIVARTAPRLSDPRSAGRGTADEVMTREVIAFAPDTSLQTAAELLFERGVGGAPVVDPLGRVVGVISKTDLVGRHLEETGAWVAAPPGMRVLDGATVADVMTSAAVVVEEGMPLGELAALLTRLRLHRVPVVSSSGGLVGIITTSDIVRWVAGLA